MCLNEFNGLDDFKQEIFLFYAKENRENILIGQEQGQMDGGKANWTAVNNID